MSFPFSGRIAHEPDLNARSAMADESIIDEESSLFGSLLNAASRNRTRDTRIFSPLLYQLS